MKKGPPPKTKVGLLVGVLVFCMSLTIRSTTVRFSLLLLLLFVCKAVVLFTL